MTDIDIDDSTRMQLDKIIKKFRKLKNEKMALTSDNTELKVECRNLRERHNKSEKHRHTLIKLCSESTQRNKARIQSLERENKQLRDIIDDQNQHIEEQSKKINKLSKDVERLGKGKDEVSSLKAQLEKLKEYDKLKNELKLLKKEKEEQRRFCENNHMNKPKVIDSKSKLNLLKQPNSVRRQLSFSHPSFESDTKASKNKRRAKSLSQLRWANLDIRINGRLSQGEDCNTSSKSSKEKKRKLYSSNDDATVDITSDE
ncbi:structural maintenance of chromosomes protein 4 isoform X2 [Copidosoma floridanum]|uniref:structural maintenance of chromosomes protein 4 isoform X2 n=1 Tax=Copidosoma floridanum TaxID=29053 RepID=UPI0006C96941|nr:structural maintenance of chromosomes protein 4 isoform X2 [Copidosoma floridanum]